MAEETNYPKLWTRLQVARRRTRPDEDTRQWLRAAWSLHRRNFWVRGTQPRGLTGRQRLVLVLDHLLGQAEPGHGVPALESTVDAWFGLLEANAEDPLALIAGLEVVEWLGRGRPQGYMRRLEALFGASVLEAAVALARRGRPTHRSLLVRWMGRRPSTPLDVLLASLDDRNRELRDAAVSGLRRRGGEVVPAMLERLERPEAHVREGAALVLCACGGQEELPALQAALSREEASFVQDALRRAAHYCDPSTSGPPPGDDAFSGVYDPRSPVDANAGVMALRELLADADPTVDSWVRLCNAVERLRTAGNLAFAVDYLGFYGVDGWQAGWRAAPLEWREDERLMAFCAETTPGRPWATVESLAAERLGACLEQIHRQARLRPTEAGRELMLDSIDAGWRFCEAHGLNPTALRLEVGSLLINDSGVVYAGGLALHRGFGLHLQPQVRTGVRVRKAEDDPFVATFDVEVPRGHPLQRTHVLPPGRRLPLPVAEAT